MTTDIPIVDLVKHKGCGKDKWELAIKEKGEKGLGRYSDGSRLDEGGVGGGWWDPGTGTGGRRGLGKISTVWDGKVSGFLRTLKATPEDAILTDSQAATAAIEKTGKLGKARTGGLRRVIEDISRQIEIGKDSVTLGWVKSHIEIRGNGKSDEMA